MTAGGSTGYSYDATGQVASVLYPNGVRHGYSYDDRDHTTEVTVTGPAGALANYAYTYSCSGRRVSAAEANGRSASYGYDAVYRLLGETIAGDPAAANNGSLGYTLDAAGNRLSLASTLAALGSQAHNYDANDRMSGDSYDANCNTLASAGGAVLLAYAGDGNRVARAEAGVTIRFLVDDLSPTGFPQVVEEVMAGQVIRQYTYGLKPVSQRRWTAGANWQVDFYGYDATGSVRQLTDTAGAVTDSYAYDAFGNVVATYSYNANDRLLGDTYDGNGNTVASNGNTLRYDFKTG